jgi:hypothetical protein
MPANPSLIASCGHGCGAVCEAVFGTREFKVTCLACPLQIEGHVDGVPFYFRARHDRWRLEVRQAGPLAAPAEVIAQGDTDEFTEGQAVDLIVAEMGKWIWPADAG